MAARYRPPHVAWWALIICWMLAVSAVWVWTVRYEFSTESPTAAASEAQWPSGSALELSPARPTLVFFLHPKCPCTRATVRELQKILTGSGLTAEQQPRLCILASRPHSVSDDWHQTDILRQALALPQCQLILDKDGREANRFGAVNSGTVMLFDPGGRRLFAGGVTVSRGHEGDNAGGDALRRLLAGQTQSQISSTPAFGCRLCAPGQAQQETQCPAVGGCSLCPQTGDEGIAE